MSNNVQVNALGDACPIPVVKTIKALAALGGAGTIETLVDNEVAVENLKRLASEKGCGVSVEKAAEKEWHVTFDVPEGLSVDAGEADDAQCLVPAKKNLVIQVSSDAMGAGSDELGRNLMKAFIYAVTQQDELPATMLFYNGGAHLTCEGSPALDDLKALAEQGVEILTCGTCLNHYGIADKLAVGEVTNMYVICQKLEQASNIVRP
ncbi:sulfurtransferase-like selenium metabolism protein YedF [Paratractidigestivibacter sp.]|jgi:selenium metabolism protein YedF|uniref:sulfurtransferase-like selenium metabolism protein YedF n=3 Tax=Coriobacteriales TaxID=84999 RepID=UPI003A8D67CF